MRIERESLGDYPFELTNFDIKIGKRRGKLKTNVDVVDRETGECGGGEFEYTQHIRLDGTEFVKVYDVSSLLGLSYIALRVFLYCLGILRYDGVILFSVSKCSECFGVDKRTIERGMKELRDGGYIAKVDSLYYINWNIAFRGNRDTLQKEIRKSKL